MIFKILTDKFSFTQKGKELTEGIVDVVECYECGHLIRKYNSQTVLRPDYEPGFREIYFCESDKRPYDMISHGMFYKRNPEYSEVDEKGKLIKK